MSVKKEKPKQVYLYIFHNEDGRSGEERLRLAAIDYICKAGSEQDDKKFINGVDIVDMIDPDPDLSMLFQVVRTDRGKPYFPNCPQIQFSISHSGSYWVCAMANEAIGVDLQQHVRLKDETIEAASVRFGKIAHRFFHPLEAGYVELNRYSNFFDVWTARESYVKYTGQGIDADFSDFCLIPEQEEQWEYLSQSTEPVSWQAQQVWFYKQRYGEDYTLCVCTKSAYSRYSLITL